MKFASILAAALLLASNVLSSPTPAKPSIQRKRAPPGFVGVEGTNFVLDGKPFFFAGTTAYWLTQLNTDEDIVATLKDIADKGLKVVRTWGFREVVGTPPSNPKTYTALWQGSTQTFNQPGFDRIKFILDTAQTLGLKIHISLTNNWAPTIPADAPRPAGYYSNSFGGMDTYIQQLHAGGDHDLFYTDEKIITQYEAFIRKIVTDFKDHPAIFAWELANDPRCRGADGTTTSGSCNTNTVTRWSNRVSALVKQLDPNHLTASGDHGFFCVTNECPKINTFPTPSGADAPQGSSTSRRKRHAGWLTASDVLAARRDQRKAAAKKARKESGTLRRIRGAWSAPVATVKSWTRQNSAETSVGAIYDGSQGVDTQDISASSHIDFTTFQLFPDQNTYSNGADSDQPPDGGAGGTNFQNSVTTGINWIVQHATSSQNMGKPTTLNGFGLVPQSSQTNFKPFDTSATNVGLSTNQVVATDSEQETAYRSWTDQAVDSGINGITHYQWGKTGLKSQSGSVVDDSNTFGDSSTESSTQGSSPNDGYASGPASGIQGILSVVANRQNGKDSS